MFLSTIGGKTYELLQNLLSPTPLETLKLSELTDVLKRHYEPKPLVIAERFHFHRRFQAADESVAEFLAQLRRLSAHCEFQSYLDQALRDRLVCGLRNENIQRRLLAEADLTLTRAFELAQGMEAAERNTKSLKSTETAIHQVDTKRNPSAVSPSSCFRCGRSNHVAKDCRFRDAVCHTCNKKGHIAPACRSKQQGAKHKSKKRFRPNPQQNRYVAVDDDQKREDDADLPIYSIREPTSNPFRTNVFVNGKLLSMEIDTGAAVSIISEESKNRLFPDAVLKKSYLRMQTYTGQRMTVQGYLEVEVRYGEQKKNLHLFVVTGTGPSLLGRSWLTHIRLDWATIAKLATESVTPSLKITNMLQYSQMNSELYRRSEPNSSYG